MPLLRQAPPLFRQPAGCGSLAAVDPIGRRLIALGVLMNILGVALVVIWLVLALVATLSALHLRSRTLLQRQLLVLLAVSVPIAGALATLYMTSRAKRMPSAQTSGDTMSIEV